MTNRPMVSTYEPDDGGVEQLVYREMNDEEFETWERDVEIVTNTPTPKHSIITQVTSMTSEERAELRQLLAEEG